jgi:uncharacterized protein YcaQ
MTTVTISDELRKRLKRLAAKYDTNQAEIIERALEIFEKLESGQDILPRTKSELERESPVDKTRMQQIRAMLAEARADFEQKYPNIAQSHKRLRQNLHLLEEASIGRWDLPFEE